MVTPILGWRDVQHIESDRAGGVLRYHRRVEEMTRLLARLKARIRL